MALAGRAPYHIPPQPHPNRMRVALPLALALCAATGALARSVVIHVSFICLRVTMAWGWCVHWVPRKGCLRFAWVCLLLCF